MSPEPPPLETLPLVCPHCQGAFQVRTEFRGLQVACPLCQQAVEVPRGSSVVPPPPPALATSPPASPLEQPKPAESPARRMGDSPVRKEQDVEPSDGQHGRVNDPSYEEPEPLRELTREERERLRRRFRIVVAVIAGIVLAVALSVLLKV